MSNQRTWLRAAREASLRGDEIGAQFFTVTALQYDDPPPTPETFRCPTARHLNPPRLSRIFTVGCGHEFEGTPDAHGNLNCPVCGIWFTETEGRTGRVTG